MRKLNNSNQSNMGKPQTNGLIELVDSKNEDSGFFCMQLVVYLGEEQRMGTPEYSDLWDIRFSQAKNHNCAYKDKCPIFAKTAAKQQHVSVQLQFDF